MQNELFDRPARRHIKDINIVPILDMLVTVIFFLLLSATFMEYTKVTVPPSKVSINTDPIRPPPLQPRLSITNPEGQVYRVRLNWSGAAAGQAEESVTAATEKDPRLSQTIQRLVQDFKSKNPEEKTLQMGLGPNVPYQVLIVVMDAVRPFLPDIVLYSYAEAEHE